MTEIGEDVAWDPYDRNCPSRAMLDLIGQRWTVLAVGALSEGALRFNEVAQRIEGISQKMLTQTLRSLERDGLVTRTHYPQVPPRVDYALTPLGESLVAPLRALEEWAKAHMDDVMSHRRQAEGEETS